MMYILILVVSSWLNSLYIPSSADATSKKYEWKKIFNVGDSRWQRWLAPVVAFDGKLWAVGQDTRTGFVWESADGMNWTKHASDAQWGVRYGMTAVFFKNRMFMMGGTLHVNEGSVTNRELMNDIWYSDNGTQWTKAVDHAGWSPRHFPVVLEFRNALWMLGSGNMPGGVWTSHDGLQWHETISSTPWAGKTLSGWFANNENIVIVTGDGDVWKSSDGIKWTSSRVETPWPGGNRVGGCYGRILDGSVWLMGGSDGDAQFKNDVWHSEDGIRWTRLSEHAPWSPRATNYSVVFKNKLWIFGGKNGEDDVWTLEVNPQ